MSRCDERHPGTPKRLGVGRTCLECLKLRNRADKVRARRWGEVFRGLHWQPPMMDGRVIV